MILPTQCAEHNGEDVGYDITATTEPNIKGEFIERAIDGMKLWKYVTYIEYGTGLFIAPLDKDTHIELFPRSSLSKYRLSLANSIGLIDAPYRGELMLRFRYLFQPEDFITIQEAGGIRTYGIIRPENIYQRGEQICQMVARQTLPITFEVVEVLPPSLRGEGRFGSTDKKE